MKNISKLLLVSILGTSAFAHNLWVKGINKDVIHADIIYGHNFPNPEEIKKERVSIFKPISIISNKDSITLTQKGKNYSYIGEEKLKKGTYIVKAKYKPTSWIKTADGKWEMNKTRKDTTKEVKSCGIYSMFAKSILVIENGDDEFITKPLGKGLEITPLEKASKLKQGNSIKFKVTMDGKPLKTHEVYGSLEGYADNEMSMAYYGKTDLRGEFVFKPLKSGFWYLKVDYKRDSKNKDCETLGDKATLSFEVKK